MHNLDNIQFIFITQKYYDSDNKYFTSTKTSLTDIKEHNDYFIIL